MGQKPYRVDENLNIIEGVPFVAEEPLVYVEQPDKMPGGRTNPYVISELIPLPSGEGMMADRVVVRYGSALHRERSVVVAGTAYCEFLDSLEDVHRLWIQ